MRIFKLIKLWILVFRGERMRKKTYRYETLKCKCLKKHLSTQTKFDKLIEELK